MIQCRNEASHRPRIVAGEAPIARQDKTLVAVTLMDLAGSKLTVVDDILRYQSALLSLRQGEDHYIRLPSEVGALCDRRHIMAATAKLERDVRRPHLIEQELHVRRRSCWRCQDASARSASSSILRIHSSISSG